MNTTTIPGKIQPFHLQKYAYVYVRQSTIKQVIDNAESTKRQYALVERAQALGWCSEAIEVIDEDLGKSGASVEGRRGFSRLVEAVAQGVVGAIFAIEVSRLARSSEDWQRLLSLCAVAGVLVIDEQTISDPSINDDKLLLDLKGTMSEAELHWLGLRLRGARMGKAKRGQLRLPAPTGYVWQCKRLVLDPDESVQQAVRVLFKRFEIEPSAWAVVRWANEIGFKVPVRRNTQDQVVPPTWKALTTSRLLDMLHNPLYAGAYVYGRRPVRKKVIDGEIRTTRSETAPEHWPVLLYDSHQGYITWETYLKNRAKLRQNSRDDTMPGAPRRGSALLTGLILCGRCARRMNVAYPANSGSPRWSYVCYGDRDHAGERCWSTPGKSIDVAVERLFLTTMVPDELELSLAVEQEVVAQADSLASQWKCRLEQARREAQVAERRYKEVDPCNRIVARTLEKQWEESLRELEDVQRHYDRARREHHVELTTEDRARIRALGQNLPLVWHSATTLLADRKAMLRLAIEAVTLKPVDIPQACVKILVQWRSGAVSELSVERVKQGKHNVTDEESIETIRELAKLGISYEEMAQRLNAAGVKTGTGRQWNDYSVRYICRSRKVTCEQPRRRKVLPSPLPDRHSDGRYSIAGAARFFGVHPEVVRSWVKRGKIVAQREKFKNWGRVCWITLDQDTTERILARPRRAHPREMPEQDANGRYSISGLANKLGVKFATIRRWITDGTVHGTYEYDEHIRQRVWWISIDDAAVELLRPEVRRRQRAHRVALPDVFPDGCYSMAGAVKRLGVSESTVRSWIKQGLLSATRTTFEGHRAVWRISLDDVTVKELGRRQGLT